MRRMMLASALMCGVMALALSGCGHGMALTIGTHGHHGHDDRGAHGPPPHAPAHGHKRVHDHDRGDLELVFDSELGVYIVVDVPNHYYWDGYYLRIEDDHWYASTELSGHWEARRSDSLPPGLRKKGKHWKAAKQRGKGKGHGPAKGRW